MEKDTRKENLRMQHLKEMIARDINNAHLEAGVVYFIIKDVLKDIENIYNEQLQIEYKEFCDEANAEVDNTNEESNSEAEESVAANINEEGTN